MSDSIEAANSDNTNGGNGKRRRALLIAASMFGAVGIIYGAYWFLSGRFYQSTDDAYVAGNVVVVTPQTPGTVIAIKADDTDFVKAGDELVLLDNADAKVALEQAEAALAQTVRQTRSLFTTNASLSANVALAQSQLAKASDDFERRRSLTKTGAVSYEELNHAETAQKSAQADLLAAQEKLATNQAFTQNTTIEEHPAVQQAAAKVHAAYLDFQRSIIPAAVDGYVAKRSVQVGQHVIPGSPLLAIIPLKQVWVDANFKEGQLAQMRIGQSVEIEADIYGSKVDYHGTIVGLGAGTGSAFSLLPAQNATGNWIKVVQRVPVKIQLDPNELVSHPLRLGLSIRATVNVKDQSGAQLATAQRGQPAYETTVYRKLDNQADEIIKSIIAKNSGSDTNQKSIVEKNQSGMNSSRKKSALVSVR